MSVQIFLQARLQGINDFLLPPQSDAVFIGRCTYISLSAELLPRILLRSLGLADLLLGSSGGGQFLLVLPEESRQAAEEFLSLASTQIAALSGSQLKLTWAITENLGDWTDVRKRLHEEFARAQFTVPGEGFFAPFTPEFSAAPDNAYFESLGQQIREAAEIGWNVTEPARFLPNAGELKLPISPESGGVPLARHIALDSEGHAPARTPGLASRASGKRSWGVLRGDVDLLGVRIRRAQNIEEHIQLSILYKRFFAGELELLCSMPGFWQRVTLLYAGVGEFAVFGAWDALIELAREVQRVFRTLASSSMAEFPGPEGRTITMAISLSPTRETTIAEVHREAGEKLELAKTTGKDTFHLLGRTLEWKQLPEVTELKDEMVKLVTDYGCDPQFLAEIGSFYRESTPTVTTKRGKSERLERPWRFHRRLAVVLGEQRGRDFQKVRTNLIADLIGKNAAQAKLRPSGRVALEWASLAVSRNEKSAHSRG